MGSHDGWRAAAAAREPSYGFHTLISSSNQWKVHLRLCYITTLLHRTALRVSPISSSFNGQSPACHNATHFSGKTIVVFALEGNTITLCSQLGATDMIWQREVFNRPTFDTRHPSLSTEWSQLHTHLNAASLLFSGQTYFWASSQQRERGRKTRLM